MSSKPGGHSAAPAEGGVTAARPACPTVKAGAAIGSRRPGLTESWPQPGGGFIFPHWRW
jgi:hypothetical protein